LSSQYIESTNTRIEVQASPGKNARPYLKITKIKRVGAVAQKVEQNLASARPCVQPPVHTYIHNSKRKQTKKHTL
jgi:hypothetical protein